MVSIASLLNPCSRPFRDYRETSSPCSSAYDSSPSSPLPPGKKQKLSKDAAIFAKGKTRGEIRYPPHEIEDEDIAKQHARFQLYPRGRIAEYCRHIPYNSEKKLFLEKTGRESFEVFQYTFKMNAEEREYTVMWDYNIGLVRVTPFFKCCNYSKTTPAKVLSNNPGLREITHSITGGALAAQGYWMPFDAAKAVAATFCHEIRYALVPVFGEDFLSLCIEPEDPSFGRMIIDCDIVQRCTEQAAQYRILSSQSSVTSSPRTPGLSEEFAGKMPKSLRPKKTKNKYSKSGYGGDAGCGEYLYAPSTPPSSSWVALNTPRSIPQWSPQPPSQPASPYPGKANLTYFRGDSSSGDESRPAKRLRVEEDEYDEPLSSRSSVSPGLASSSKKLTPMSSDDAKAACLLMRIHMDDAKIERTGLRARRASA